MISLFVFQYESKDASDWIGKGGEVLKGFSWRNGPDRDTTGVWMWSHVFMHDFGKEKFAIILIDTQGVFDKQSTDKDSEFIFALSTLISSVQIYNLSQNIEDSDLLHFQLFTEHGRLALEKSNSKPFQRLQFLVRDWGYDYKYKYGALGGNSMLNKCLEITTNQHDELKSVRQHLKSCFSEVDCFLMPHPGLAVCQEQRFRGELDSIDDRFKDQLKDLVSSLLSPKKLRSKIINGQQIVAGDFILYIKSYVKALGSDSFIKPVNITNAEVEASHTVAFSQAKELYIEETKKLCDEAAQLSEENFQEKYDDIRKKCLLLVSCICITEI